MTTNAEITIYHYDEEAEQWIIIYTGAAHVYKTCAAQVGKDNAKDDKSVVRIPTSEDLTIRYGDKIVTEATDAPSPPKSGALTVIGWGDRRYGANPHWRLDVK